MRGDDTDNQPAESDTTPRERAGSSQAEPPRDGSRAEPRRDGSQAEPRGVVSDSATHDRHDAAIFAGAARAERRHELALDNQPPLDVSGSLAERVRTTFTADADTFGTGAKAEKDAEKDAADAKRAALAEDAKARAAVAGEKTPIMAALAQLQKKQAERARRGPAPRLRPAPNVGRKPPGRGLVGGGRVQERPKPPATKSTGRGGPAPRF